MLAKPLIPAAQIYAAVGYKGDYIAQQGEQASFKRHSVPDPHSRPANIMLIGPLASQHQAFNQARGDSGIVRPDKRKASAGL